MKWLSLSLSLTHHWQHATSFQQPPKTNGWKSLLKGVRVALFPHSSLSRWSMLVISILAWRVAASMTCCDFIFCNSPLSFCLLMQTHTHTHTGEICPVATVLQCWLAASERGMPGISSTPQIGLRQGNWNPFSFSIISLKQFPPYSPVPSRDSVKWLILTLLIVQYTRKSVERGICCNKKE